MLLQISFGVVTPLTDALILVREPGATLFDNLVLHRQVEQFTRMADTTAIHNIKFYLLKRRGQLIFDNFYLRTVAQNVLTGFDGVHAADIQPQGGIKFQRIAASGGLGIAKENPD